MRYMCYVFLSLDLECVWVTCHVSFFCWTVKANTIVDRNRSMQMQLSFINKTTIESV